MSQTVTLGGNPIQVAGQLPAAGSTGPAFTLTGKDLGEVTLAGLGPVRKVLNIFPSIDTPTCATSVRRFNQAAGSWPTPWSCAFPPTCLLPRPASAAPKVWKRCAPCPPFRNPEFLQNYGVAVENGPLKGLCARAVVVLDADNKVLHSELVGEIKNEPNYDAALAALK